MTTQILLRDGVSRQAVSNGIRHQIDNVDLEEPVCVLRAKAAPLLQLKAEEIGCVSLKFTFKKAAAAYRAAVCQMRAQVHFRTTPVTRF